MTAHTPGPWAFGGLLGSIEVVSGRVLVATCVMRDDARLIAAAPDLLAALEELLHHPGRTTELAALRALAKALGKPQGQYDETSEAA